MKLDAQKWLNNLYLEDKLQLVYNNKNNSVFICHCGHSKPFCNPDHFSKNSNLYLFASTKFYFFFSKIKFMLQLKNFGKINVKIY